MVSSGCSGWEPNAAEYATAPAMPGPWTRMGNPCIGPDAEKTFNSQSTFVLPVHGKRGAFIFMADRWQKEDLRESSYVWLPITINVNGALSIKWFEEWNLAFYLTGLGAEGELYAQ
jgi:hypothetical protein